MSTFCTMGPPDANGRVRAQITRSGAAVCPRCQTDLVTGMMSDLGERSTTLMPGEPPPPVAPRRYGGRALVISLVAGFVAAAVICIALAAGGALPGQQKDSGGGGGSTAPVSLPAHFLTYSRLADVPVNKSNPGKQNAEDRAADDRKTAAALSAANHGAGAAVQSYGSDDLQTLFSVWAVRDATPPPVFPVVSAERLGLAVPPEVVQSFGAVVCAIRYDSIVKGQPITPERTHTLICQRSNSSLTVIVQTPNGDIGGHPDQVAAMVDAVWSDLA
jgi:hypothetical protein